MPDPDIRRAIDAVRHHDRPADVDREQLLQKILSDAAAPKAPPSRAGALAAGAIALALVGALAWRASRPTERPNVSARTPAVQSSRPVDQTGTRVDQTGDPGDQTGTRVDQTGDPGDQTGTRIDQARVPPVQARAARHVAEPSPEEDEWRIIREADRALQAHDPERALRILARHTAQHPRGVAGPEVMAYRVRAYCMAGRTADAEATARELRARAPDSPAAYSLRATCASVR